MAPKTPLDYSLAEYTWIVVVAGWGGMISWYAKLRNGRPFSLLELVGELMTSGFSGVVVFWICELQSVHPLLTAALVGIAGHLGSRSIFIIERYVARRISPETIKDLECADEDPPGALKGRRTK